VSVLGCGAVAVSLCSAGDRLVQLREAVDVRLHFVSPVVLGGGTHYFPALEERINLELVETQTFVSRVVYVR